MSSLTFILVVAAARKNNFPGAGLDESCLRVEVPHTFLTNWNTKKLHYTLWKPFVRKKAEIQRYKPCKRKRRNKHARRHWRHLLNMKLGTSASRFVPQDTQAETTLLQSRAQTFSGCLSAVGLREKLRDNGISLNIL